MTTNGSKYEGKPFARLSKNFINKDEGFGNAVLNYGVTGFDLYVLAEALNALQRDIKKNGDPTLVFVSMHEAMLAFGLEPGGKNRRALAETFQRWCDVRFDFERWDWGENSRRGQYRERSFRRVWSVKHTRSGGIRITFDREFWKANYSTKRFVKMYPELVRELRYTSAILLELLLEAFGGKIEMDPDKLAAKIGLMP